MFPKHVAIDPRVFGPDRTAAAGEADRLLRLVKRIKRYGCLADDRDGKIRKALGKLRLDPNDPRQHPLAEILSLYKQAEYNRRHHSPAADDDVSAILEYLLVNMPLDFVFNAGVTDLLETPMFSEEMRPNLLISATRSREQGLNHPANHPEVGAWLRRGLAGSGNLRIYDRYLLNSEGPDPSRSLQQHERGRQAILRVLQAWLSLPAAAGVERTLQAFVGFDRITPGDGDEERAMTRGRNVRKDLEKLFLQQDLQPADREIRIRCQIFVRKKQAEDHARYLASDWAFYLLADGLDRLAPGGNPAEPFKFMFERDLKELKDSASISSAKLPKHLREDWIQVLPAFHSHTASTDSHALG